MQRYISGARYVLSSYMSESNHVQAWVVSMSFTQLTLKIRNAKERHCNSKGLRANKRKIKTLENSRINHWMNRSVEWQRNRKEWNENRQYRNRTVATSKLQKPHCSRTGTSISACRCQWLMMTTGASDTPITQINREFWWKTSVVRPNGWTLCTLSVCICTHVGKNNNCSNCT